MYCAPRNIACHLACVFYRESSKTKVSVSKSTIMSSLAAHEITFFNSKHFYFSCGTSK